VTIVLSEGQRAPDFTLPDDQGQSVRLRDFHGHRVVLWFYVRDDTPG
jgi:thioredoxin-dependent peroxiredoxin